MPGRKTILLVEDDVSIAKRFEEELTKESYAFEHLDRGEAALERLALGGVDLLILDQHLPDGLGTELIEILKKKYSDLPIIMVTSHQDVSIAVSALKSGAMDYLVKDSDHIFLDQLPRVVKGVFERASLTRRNDALIDEMRKKEERLRGIFQHSPYAIALLDIRGRVVSANLTTAESFGLTHPSEIEGFRILDVLKIDPKNEEIVLHPIVKRQIAIDFSCLGNARLPRMKRSGSALFEICLRYLLADGDSGAAHYMLHLNDITAQTDASTKLQNINRAFIQAQRQKDLSTRWKILSDVLMDI